MADKSASSTRLMLACIELAEMLRAGMFDALNACSGQAFHPLPFASLREILFAFIRVHWRSLFAQRHLSFVMRFAGYSRSAANH
jgi:hypothetical protein